jgi:hypothetical protein
LPFKFNLQRYNVVEIVAVKRKERNDCLIGRGGAVHVESSLPIA